MTIPELSLAASSTFPKRDLRADVAVLAAELELAAWQKTHAANRVELAHYQTEKDRTKQTFGGPTAGALPQSVAARQKWFAPLCSMCRMSAMPPLPEKEDKA